MRFTAALGNAHEPPLRITEAVQTCFGCPSQWDAWTVGGTYLYLRFRYGIGTVQRDANDGPVIREFGTPSLDGVIDLGSFMTRAGMEWA